LLLRIPELTIQKSNISVFGTGKISTSLQQKKPTAKRAHSKKSPQPQQKEPKEKKKPTAKRAHSKKSPQQKEPKEKKKSP